MQSPLEEDGRHGEGLAHAHLKRLGKRLLQADWIVMDDDQDYLYEVKFQEVFEPPPWYGHGLPKWQVDARLALQERRGIRAVLLVFDKKTGRTYQQFLDVLERGSHHDTHGERPRRIYPLRNFIELERWQEAAA